MARAHMPRSGIDEIQVLRPSGTTQHIDVLATSVAVSTAFASNVIRIGTTVAICYEINSAPTAIGATSAGADNYLPAGGVEYVKVVSGSDKIAVIAQDEATAGGVVYIGEYL